MFYVREVNPEDRAEGEDYNETIKDVITTAVKFYVFIAALVLLDEGFKPIILEYFTSIPLIEVYWINTISAILDNATLAAAQIGPFLNEFQIKSALMALLISGGMLIPGSIANIVSAGKLDITGFPQISSKKNIFLAIVFEELFNNLQLLSQLKLK